jgi:MFS transporter, CP family, cyanate transporter
LTTSPNRPDRPDRRLFLTLALGYATLSAGLGSNGALVRLRDELHFSSTLVGIHGAAFGVCLLVLGLRGPRLVSRAGERNAFLMAVGVIAIGGLLFASAFHVVQSILGAAAIGFGSALLVVVIPATVDRSYPENSASVFSRLNAWPSGMGIAQGPLLALFMQSTTGWRVPLAIWIISICALATWLGATSLHNDHAKLALTSPFQLLRNRALRIATARNAFGVVCEFTFAVFVGTLVRELLHVSTAIATASGALFSIGTTMSRGIGPRLLARFHERLEAFCYAGCAVSSLLFALPLPTPVRLAGVIGYGFCSGPVYVFGTGRMFRTGNNDPGVAGLGALASGVAIAFGPVILGVLSDNRGWLAAALFFPIMCAVGGLWTLRSSLEPFGKAPA